MQKIVDMFLTKEAFNEYAKRLREEQAREHGMTLEQWDDAVRTGATVNPNTQLSSSPTTSSLNNQ